MGRSETYLRHLGVAFALATTLLGCEGDPASPSDQPGTPTERDGPTEVEMVALMEGHYTSAISGHDALIRGNVEAVRSRLREISTRTLPAFAPESWRSHERRLQEAARGAKDASTLEAAALAMGAVAEACGACHEAVGLGDIYRKPDPAQGNNDLETAMLGHQWATERLWEGVTGPWDDAWKRGASALAEARLFENVGSAVVSADLIAQEAAMREMGRTAMTTTSPTDRARLYGRLLAGCAVCHLEAGVTH